MLKSVYSFIYVKLISVKTDKGTNSLKFYSTFLNTLHLTFLQLIRHKVKKKDYGFKVSKSKFHFFRILNLKKVP